MARISREAAAQKAVQAKWKAAIYIRLSREDGSDESYSVTNQRQRLSAYFDSIAAEEGMYLTDVYIDDGYTGTDSNRDNFQRLLRDLDEGRVNCIIVKDLSRLSRNDWECKRYLQHLFVVKDVRFISLELPRLDSYKRPDEIYDLGVTMQSAYNENHCRETSIKVRGTLDAKRRAGEFIGAFAPYGYEKDPADKHKLIVDSEAAQIVRDVFHWFVREGMSKVGIVKRLAALGVPSPAAYKRQKGMNYQSPLLKGEPLWSAQAVAQMLSNRVYIGHMVQGRQKVKSYKVHTRVKVPEEEWFIKENTHEPIIDEAFFAQAQRLLQRDTRTAPNAERLYPFSGFLRCADCGKAMVRRPAKNNRVYYACRTYTTTGSMCTKHSLRHDKLEGVLLAALQVQIDLLDGWAEIIEEINQAPAACTESLQPERLRKQRMQELERVSAIRTGLFMDWKNGDITREEYHNLKQELAEKEARLQQEIIKMEENSSASQENTSNEPMLACFCKHKKITELNRGIVAELVKVIHVCEGGGVVAEFNFAGQWNTVVIS